MHRACFAVSRTWYRACHCHLTTPMCPRQPQAAPAAAAAGAPWRRLCPHRVHRRRAASSSWPSRCLQASRLFTRPAAQFALSERRQRPALRALHASAVRPVAPCARRYQPREHGMPRRQVACGAVSLGQVPCRQTDGNAYRVVRARSRIRQACSALRAAWTPSRSTVVGVRLVPPSPPHASTAAPPSAAPARAPVASTMLLAKASSRASRRSACKLVPVRKPLALPRTVAIARVRCRRWAPEWLGWARSCPVWTVRTMALRQRV